MSTPAKTPPAFHGSKSTGSTKQNKLEVTPCNRRDRQPAAAMADSSRSMYADVTRDSFEETSPAGLEAAAALFGGQPQNEVPSSVPTRGHQLTPMHEKSCCELPDQLNPPTANTVAVCRVVDDTETVRAALKFTWMCVQAHEDSDCTYKPCELRCKDFGSVDFGNECCVPGFFLSKNFCCAQYDYGWLGFCMATSGDSSNGDSSNGDSNCFTDVKHALWGSEDTPLLVKPCRCLILTSLLPVIFLIRYLATVVLPMILVVIPVRLLYSVGFAFFYSGALLACGAAAVALPLMTVGSVTIRLLTNAMVCIYNYFLRYMIIMSVVVGVTIVQCCKAVGSAITSSCSFICENILKPTCEAFAPCYEAVGSAIASCCSFICENILKPMCEAFSACCKAVGSAIASCCTVGYDAVAPCVHSMCDVLGACFEAIGSAIAAVARAIGSAIAALARAIGSAVAAIGSALSSIFSR